MKQWSIHIVREGGTRQMDKDRWKKSGVGMVKREEKKVKMRHWWENFNSGKVLRVRGPMFHHVPGSGISPSGCESASFNLGTGCYFLKSSLANTNEMPIDFQMPDSFGWDFRSP